MVTCSLPPQRCYPLRHSPSRPDIVFADVTRPSGAAEVDLRVEDFEVTEGGERREIVSAKMTRRPVRLVLVVDATDGIRQPVGLVRTALTAFVNGIDPQVEMMLVTVAGTPQVHVRPTLERQQIVKSVANIFGTSGANTMHRVIDDLFHRFAQTTESSSGVRRPHDGRVRVDAEHQPAADYAHYRSFHLARRHASRRPA